MNTAWLLVPAMRSLGYYEEARRVVTSLELSVDRYGFREYYNPLSGRGLAARGFGFSTLIVDLLADCAVDRSLPTPTPPKRPRRRG
jgi:mannosylglycerate hydrolase